MGTTIWGKTLAITTFTLALAALLSSAIIMVGGNSLLQMLRWQEVSNLVLLVLVVMHLGFQTRLIV